MNDLIKQIEIRIETNDECIGNVNLSEAHKESIESENEFLNSILSELQQSNCEECHQDSGHSIDCSKYAQKVPIECSKIIELHSLVVDIQYLENLQNIYPLTKEQNQELYEKNGKLQYGVKNLIP